jgi:hypothetical protein
MATGATVTEPRSKANENTADEHRQRRGIDDHCWYPAAYQANEERTGDQSEDEGNSPRDLLAVKTEQTTNDAGDASNPAETEHQHYRTEADQQASGQC